MKRNLLYVTFFLFSCAAPEKRVTDKTASGDSSSSENIVSENVATTDTTLVDRADKTSVALKFINDYVKHLNSGDPFDPMNWVENNELATDEFKASYKAIIAEGLRDEPETGLSYDPILNAQDYPMGFKFARLEENEFVVVKGTDQPQFTNVLRIRFVVDRWLVDGAGVVNIPEEKRGLR